MDYKVIDYNDKRILFNTKTKEVIVSNIFVSQEALNRMPIYPKNLWVYYNNYVVGIKKDKINLRNIDDKNIINALKRRQWV